jgi:hypothetical protein
MEYYREETLSSMKNFTNGATLTAKFHIFCCGVYKNIVTLSTGKCAGNFFTGPPNPPVLWCKGHTGNFNNLRISWCGIFWE